MLNIILCLIFMLFSSPAFAQGMPQSMSAPMIVEDAKVQQYNDIFAMLSKNGAPQNIDQICTTLLMMLQMMPPEDRTKMAMDIADRIQSSPKKDRLNGLASAAKTLKSLTNEQLQKAIVSSKQAADIFQPIERQLIGVQLDKILSDIPSLPDSKDREILTSTLNTLVTHLLSKP